MNRRENETAVLAVPPAPCRPGVSPADLRRAMRFGERAAGRLGGLPFPQIERGLRTEWERRREEPGWEWVRAAVRAGYEQDADED